MRSLRIARRRVALLAAVAELAGSWSLETQMAALSRFADAAVGAALRHLLRALTTGGAFTPVDPADPEQGSGLIVLGLGKLGGQELNYSSDIDLILLHDPASPAAPAPDRAQSLFGRVARDLVRILDERTGDGYVFRTDLRLRPDPRSTPLAISVPAALTYYETVGQNWERAALIKARPVAGDLIAARHFLAELQPFIWRRNLDFAAIEDIHSIKRQIQAHKGGGRIAVEGHDIKTGRGGIREIEFFAQTQQLIWGGRMRALRVGPTCAALRALAATGRIDAATADTLIDHYRFLRRVEHRLQMVEDAQTHRLPPDRDGVARIAVFLGYTRPDDFVAELRARLGAVEKHYAELFEEAPSLAGPGNLVFTGTEDDPETLATLARLGFAEPARVAAMVRGWHHGRIRATRSQRAREILTEFVPELLRVFGAHRQPRHGDPALRPVPVAAPGRSAAVLAVSRQSGPVLAGRRHHGRGAAARRRPGAPAGAARRGADRRVFFAACPAATGSPTISPRCSPARAISRTRSTCCGAGPTSGDFRSGCSCCAARSTATRPAPRSPPSPMPGLAALLPAVTADFARAHGEVPGGGFAIVAMGRLGSREMTLASDLDLILIYQAPDDIGLGSTGARPLAVQTYYARLSQSLISAITAPTAEGRLYEVDMRLRPSGDSGPIASSLAAFAQYQRESAWTWEHMALTRARPIAGDPALCERAAAAIRAALTRKRDPRKSASRCRRHAAAHRRQQPGAVAVGSAQPARWAGRSRIHRAIPAAARGGPERSGGGRCCAAIRSPRSPRSARPACCRRKARASLGEALILLRHLRALLALLFDGVPDPAMLAGPAGATPTGAPWRYMARCAGAIDFAQARKRYDCRLRAGALLVRAADRRAGAGAGGTRRGRREGRGDGGMSVTIGDEAPDFTLPTDGNGSVRLSELRGKSGRAVFLSEGRHVGLHR